MINPPNIWYVSGGFGIFVGEMYLVSFDVDGEEFVTVKFLQKSVEQDHVCLVSQNEYHKPLDVHISRIRAMVFVKTLLRVNSIKSIMLIECSECGKQVSDKAAACPGCGNPITAEESSQNHPGDHDQRYNIEPEKEPSQWLHGRNDGCFMRVLNRTVLIIAIIIGLIFLLTAIK